MGFWRAERGTGADAWADTLGLCMAELAKQKLSGYCDVGKEGYEITMADFADLVEFCTRGHIIAELRYPEKDGSRPLSKLGDGSVETYSNRGQIHCKEEEVIRLIKEKVSGEEPLA